MFTYTAIIKISKFGDFYVATMEDGGGIEDYKDFHVTSESLKYLSNSIVDEIHKLYPKAKTITKHFLTEDTVNEVVLYDVTYS